MENSLIRKKWRKAFFIFLACQMVIGILGFLLLLLVGGPSMELLEALLPLILLPAVMGIFYYFAYAKQGTKWILMYMILSPVSILVPLGKDLYEEYQVTQSIIDVAIISGSSLFILIPWSYFWIQCTRLYKCNRKAELANIA